MGVRLLMSAGAPVPTRLLRDVRTVLPNADLHTPYGMTEALPVTDISLEQIETAGAGDGVCVGQPLPGVDVALSLLSPTGTADEPPVTVANQVGEICVRADHVKDHYDALWGTQRSSSRNQGWHRTGDVGHLDDQGRLWVAGRLQHVITTASGVVTPVGVEQRVESLAQVRAAAVVGIGPTGTQQVAVVVVPVRRVRRLSPVTASVPLTDQVRSVAGVDLAAVLVVASLPVDIRHASKVDRTKVASWATRVLAGG
jgi:acyl-CoA synthetase (AMP-forming)/AMP-acid ligase II